MLSFTAIDHDRVACGELTVTWRLWKYAHVKAGRPYSTGFGHVYVEDVRVVPARDVRPEDAVDAGLPDVPALLELVGSHTGTRVGPDDKLYRVQFRYLKAPPPRPQLSLAEIDKRLARLDAASKRGPWTLTVLRTIETNPGVGSRLLAAELDVDQPSFKLNVRKLKGLGLTISLDTGYELSELGQAYLDQEDTARETDA